MKKGNKEEEEEEENKKEGREEGQEREIVPSADYILSSSLAFLTACPTDFRVAKPALLLHTPIS